MLPFAQAERRKLFGYPSAFANGNMFAGLFQESLVLRLPEAERAKFLKLKGAHPFEPMAGRPMREYVVVPDAMLKSSRQLRGWLAKSYDYARTLPPKVKQK
jgi:TfoX/Sxy family transcriptional regulator of competence genes